MFDAKKVIDNPEQLKFIQDRGIAQITLENGVVTIDSMFTESSGVFYLKQLTDKIYDLQTIVAFIQGFEVDDEPAQEAVFPITPIAPIVDQINVPVAPVEAAPVAPVEAAPVVQNSEVVSDQPAQE